MEVDWMKLKNEKLAIILAGLAIGACIKKEAQDSDEKE